MADTKFFSEMTPAEMKAHHDAINAKGSLMSDTSIRNGKTPSDMITSHLLAVKKYEGQEAHDRERDRIRGLQRTGGVPVTA